MSEKQPHPDRLRVSRDPREWLRFSRAAGRLAGRAVEGDNLKKDLPESIREQATEAWSRTRRLVDKIRQDVEEGQGGFGYYTFTLDDYSYRVLFDRTKTVCKEPGTLIVVGRSTADLLSTEPGGERVVESFGIFLLDKSDKMKATPRTVTRHNSRVDLEKSSNGSFLKKVAETVSVIGPAARIADTVFTKPSSSESAMLHLMRLEELESILPHCNAVNLLTDATNLVSDRSSSQ